MTGSHALAMSIGPAERAQAPSPSAYELPKDPTVGIVTEAAGNRTATVKVRLDGIATQAA
jgi:hypothetical protein